MKRKNRDAFDAWYQDEINAPLPEGLPFEGWGVWGRYLMRTRERNWWKAAYWLAFGERKFAQTYVQIAEDCGVSRNTLYNATKIANAFANLHLSVEVEGEDGQKARRNIPLPSFWNCQALANQLLNEEERLMLVSQAVENKFSQKKIEALVSNYLKAKSIPEETPPPPPSFNGGLAKDAPDDGLPIAPNGKAEKERAKQAGEAIAARLNLPETTPPQAEGQQESDPFDELKTLRLEAAMYQKVKPYLERIEKCIEEDILDWLRAQAEAAEEEKAWAEQNG